MNFNSGDLVRVINPESLKEMSLVGVVTKKSTLWLSIWIPDINREIEFAPYQLENLCTMRI